MGIGPKAYFLLPKTSSKLLPLPKAADRDGQPYRETEAVGRR